MKAQELRKMLALEKDLARCTRRQVGCIIMQKDVVVGRGHNKGKGHDCLKGECPRGLSSYEEIPAFSNYNNCIAIHAEAAALDEADWEAAGGTAYVTCVPCADCAKLLVEAGIKRVVILEMEA